LQGTKWNELFEFFLQLMCRRLSKLTRACGSACPPSSVEEWATSSRDLHGIVLKLTVTPPIEQKHNSLVHLPDELVDELLAVTKVTTLDEVLELAGTETASGGRELEGPEEVGDGLEVGADGVDLVDDVLNAGDTELAEVGLDELVVGDRQALLVDLSVTALVDKLADGLQVGVSVSDERLDDLQHLAGGLGEADEDTVVDLEKTEELEGLALLGVDLVDTLDTDNKGKAGLSGDEERVVALRGTLGLDDIALGLCVLLGVLGGALLDDLALLLAGLRNLSQL
jgi:hypothetical protein